ncbi:MAG: DUF1080 domain-containing protein [Bacteroidales bacterium]|jgi:hypothetical protein|nr:DUF1080 domain-containing protein [Bacteroidales bacterium]
MKRLLIIGFMLLPFLVTFGQQRQRPPQPEGPQQYPARMTPQMTEFFEPAVPVITPATQVGMAPSDAIILFDGSDVNKEWEDSRGNPTKWVVQDGALVCVKGSGVVQTKRKFNDFQLHIEWKSPENVIGDGQGRGNSGVYLQGLYEVQVLDSYNNPTYKQGQAGALYKQYAPLVNVSRKPGEWQCYDIIFTAPRFGKDTTTYFTPPRVTVLHNGVVIQNNVSLRGPTLYIGIPEYSVKPHGAMPLVLQDHGNPVAYRNIWIREL